MRSDPRAAVYRAPIEYPFKVGSIAHEGQDVAAGNPTPPPVTNHEVAPPGRPGRRVPRWPFALVAVFLVIGLLVVFLWPVKVPYYAMSPGPVEEVTDLITVVDNEIFSSKGDLYLLTVGLRQVNIFEFLEAQLDGKVDLVRRERIRPPDVSPEEKKRRDLELMDESVRTAIFVALTRLGYEVELSGDGAEVLSLVIGSGADGEVRVGDIVVAVDGEPVGIGTDAVRQIQRREVGDTVVLTIKRGEETLDVAIELVASTFLEGAPMVGIEIQTVNLQFDFPIRIDVDSRNIGGPSAGMMYALAVMDLLTAEDLTRGHRIAGTGTIDSDGAVGPIGGVRQKVFAARAVGAEYVLVPAGNLENALAAADEEIKIVPVDTIDDALAFLEGLESEPVATAAG
ncbi:MAG: PDZ domain-containing protein [Acidimicrobiia bacterium]